MWRTLVLLILFLQHASSHAAPRRYVEGIPLDPVDEESENQSEGPPVTLALLVTTPLLNENTYEQNFSTVMAQLLLGLPTGSAYIETGIRASFSRITLGTSGSEFAHYFLDVPLRLLSPLLVGERVDIYLILGVIVRALEYDTRPTADGGWGRSQVSSQVLGDLGLLWKWRLGDAVRIRLELSTAQFGGGLELGF